MCKSKWLIAAMIAAGAIPGIALADESFGKVIDATTPEIQLYASASKDQPVMKLPKPVDAGSGWLILERSHGYYRVKQAGKDLWVYAYDVKVERNADVVCTVPPANRQTLATLNASGDRCGK